MISVRRALALSFLERYLLIMLALASNMILARLLTPDEIGIYSVTLALVGIAHVLRDFGVGNFLIQERELNDDHVRTAFGLSLLVGLGLFAGLFGAAPLIADFYNEPRMTGIVRVVAVNFLVLPFCTISLALLRREMQFQRLLYVTLSATVIGFVVTIVLALQGHGAVSMALGAVVMNAATGAGAWLARGSHRALLPNLREWRKVLHFGGQNVAASLVTTVSMDINDLVVGKLLGFAPVAIISRAQGLMNLFHRELMTAVRNVAYPAFAKGFRDGAPLDQQHSASVTAVTACAWPFYGFVALFPLEIMRLMFGPQWDAAASLVPLFCLAGAVAALANLVLSLIMAVGRVDLVTQAELLFQPLRAVMIVVAAMVWQSLLACALAYVIAMAIQVPVAYAFKQRCLPTGWATLGRGLARSLAVTAACLAVPAVVSWQMGLQRAQPLPIGWFVLIAALTCLGWVVALFVMRHPLAQEPAVLRLLRLTPKPSATVGMKSP